MSCYVISRGQVKTPDDFAEVMGLEPEFVAAALPAVRPEDIKEYEKRKAAKSAPASEPKKGAH